MEDWPGIMRRHTAMVWETVFRILGRESDAADAFQETFIAALRLARRQRVDNWEATLRHVATARAIDVLRRRLRDNCRIDEKPEWESLVVNDPGPLEEIQNRELIEQLRLSLAELTPQQAEAYCLRYINEWSYEQIADHCKVTVSAVGTMLNRTRARLIELLRKRIALHEVKNEK